MMNFIRYTRTLFTRSVGEFLADNAPHNAAAISYYVLFSIFPLVIFVIGAAGFFFGAESRLREDIVDTIVEEAAFSEGTGRDQVRDAVQGIEGPGGGLFGLVGLAGMLWSASAMFAAIRRGLNAAFDDEEAKRPFVQQKLIDLGLVMGLALLFLLSLAAGATLRYVANSTEDIGGLGRFADDLGLLWDAASFLLPLLLAFVAFLALYIFVPSRARPPSEVWPGALVGAVAFGTLNLLFSFYLENFSNYNVVFGSLGAVIAFLTWVYLTANIVLFGAEVASEHPHVRAEPVTQPSLDGLKEPLRQRIWGAIRSLFVREGEPPVEDPMPKH
jgi:membrane protein